LAACFLLAAFNEAGSVKPEHSRRPRLGQPSPKVRAEASLAGQAALVDAGSLQASGYPPIARARHSNSNSTVAEGTDEGGTACQCICGDRVVWSREVFAGNVVAKKEHECEHQICPRVAVPGLKVQAKCAYVKKMSELTAGTVCNCQCGDKIVWRNRAFYGDVREEKKKECLKSLCPRINPVPGYRFTAQCAFDQRLFAQPVQQPKAWASPRAAFSGCSILAVASSMAFAGIF